MSWEEVGNKVEKGPGGLLKVLVLWTVVIIAVGFGIGALFKPAALLSEATKIDKIIYNYEYFYNKSESYTALKGKIRTANGSVANFKEDAGPRSEWTYEDKTEMARLRSIADGLVYQCEDLVADYNAKTKQVTRSMFKTGSTPYQLSGCQ